MWHHPPQIRILSDICISIVFLNSLSLLFSFSTCRVLWKPIKVVLVIYGRYFTPVLPACRLTGLCQAVQFFSMTPLPPPPSPTPPQKERKKALKNMDQAQYVYAWRQLLVLLFMRLISLQMKMKTLNACVNVSPWEEEFRPLRYSQTKMRRRPRVWKV